MFVLEKKIKIVGLPVTTATLNLSSNTHCAKCQREVYMALTGKGKMIKVEERKGSELFEKHKPNCK